MIVIIQGYIYLSRIKDGSALCEQLQPLCLEEEKEIDKIKEEEKEEEEEGRMQEQKD